MPADVVGSIPCPKCIPPERVKELEAQTRRPVVGDWWITDDEKGLYCMNCGYTRPYHRKTYNPLKTGLNSLQKSAIEKIRRYFKAGREAELYRFETTLTPYGVWLYVEDEANTMIMTGGSFFIGKRGKITIHSVYDVTGSQELKRDIAKERARSLKAHVSKHF